MPRVRVFSEPKMQDFGFRFSNDIAVFVKFSTLFVLQKWKYSLDGGKCARSVCCERFMHRKYTDCKLVFHLIFIIYCYYSGNGLTGYILSYGAVWIAYDWILSDVLENRAEFIPPNDFFFCVSFSCFFFLLVFKRENK